MIPLRFASPYRIDKIALAQPRASTDPPPGSNSAPAVAASSSSWIVALCEPYPAGWLTTSRTLSGSLDTQSANHAPRSSLPVQKISKGVCLYERPPQFADQERISGQLSSPSRATRARTASSNPPRCPSKSRCTNSPTSSPERPSSRRRTTSSERREVGQRLRESQSGTSASVSRKVANSSTRALHGGLREVAQQEQRRHVGPVAVLDHQQRQVAAG